MSRAVLPALIVALLLFARVVTFPFVNWDDPSHFLLNPLALDPLAHGWSGLFWTREIGYPAPILQLSFALDMALFGKNPGPWHVENLLFHLANISMLFVLARRLGLSAREAGASALLFAIHPLVVEPVCWVTGRKDVLGVAMVLGACLVATGRSRGRIIVANLLAMCAVLVLPRMIVAAPVVAIALHAVGRPRREALAMLPALVFAAVVVFLGMKQVAELGALPPPRGVAGTLGDVAATWALQLGHLVWPVDLLAYYFRVPGDPHRFVMFVSAAVAIAGGWWALKRTEPRSPERTGLLIAFVAYGPVSCLFAIIRWTADSYMYLPLAGLSIALVPAVARRFPERLAGFGRWAGYGLAAVLALLSLSYTSRWSSSREVWRGGIERYPDVALAIEHEALALLTAGEKEEANALFIQIAERFPDFADTFDDEVRAYEAAGNAEAARAVLRRAVRSGHRPCIRMFWRRVLQAPDAAGPLDAELVSTAFAAEIPAMKAGSRDPELFARLAAVLRSVGLESDAKLVDAHRETLLR